MSGFAIRRASTADIPQIIDIQKKTWWVTYESIIGREQCDYMFDQMYSQDSLQQQMTDLKHQFILLFKKGVAVGFASYGKINGGMVYKLHKIYVIPEMQGLGAGRFLLRGVEELLLNDGAHELRLNVNRHNPAKDFYDRMGYSVLYEEDIPIGNYWMNDYVMGKRLGEGCD